jgi:hypothetical protein
MPGNSQAGTEQTASTIGCGRSDPYLSASLAPRRLGVKYTPWRLKIESRAVSNRSPDQTVFPRARGVAALNRRDDPASTKPLNYDFPAARRLGVECQATRRLALNRQRGRLNVADPIPYLSASLAPRRLGVECTPWRPDIEESWCVEPKPRPDGIFLAPRRCGVSKLVTIRRRANPLNQAFRRPGASALNERPSSSTEKDS